MPCYETRNAKTDSDNREYILTHKLNHVTHLLCGLCKRSKYEILSKDIDLLNWYEDHESKDAIRDRYLDVIRTENSDMSKKLSSFLKVTDASVIRDCFSKIYPDFIQFKNLTDKL
tara:strand:- start:428 stop:772 length:345 start_codon:yes stop_codon:yes gene_type:complete